MEKALIRCDTYYRRPWANPTHLDLPIVRRCLHWGVLALPCVRDARIHNTLTVRHTTPKATREQAVALYRAGALWLCPCTDTGLAGVALTPEAERHPDVIEMLWSKGQ